MHRWSVSNFLHHTVNRNRMWRRKIKNDIFVFCDIGEYAQCIYEKIEDFYLKTFIVRWFEIFQLQFFSNMLCNILEWMHQKCDTLKYLKYSNFSNYAFYIDNIPPQGILSNVTLIFYLCVRNELQAKHIKRLYVYLDLIFMPRL